MVDATWNTAGRKGDYLPETTDGRPMRLAICQPRHAGPGNLPKLCYGWANAHPYRVFKQFTTGESELR